MEFFKKLLFFLIIFSLIYFAFRLNFQIKFIVIYYGDEIENLQLKHPRKYFLNKPDSIHLNTIKHIYQNRVLFEKKSLKEKRNRSNKITNIDVYPIKEEPDFLNKNLKNLIINWKTFNSSIATFTRISIYPYGQNAGIFNHISYFYINKLIEGNQHVQIPNQAGYYDVKYILDNNIKALVTYGPIIINPRDSFINIVNDGYHRHLDEEINLHSGDFKNYQNNFMFNNRNDFYNKNHSQDFDLYNFHNMNNYFRENKLKIEWKIGLNTLESIKDIISNRSENYNNKDTNYIFNDTNRNLIQFYKNQSVLNNNNYDYNSYIGFKKEINQIENDFDNKFNIFICLNPIGSNTNNLEDCILKKKLNLNKFTGYCDIDCPVFAGYYYLRIFLEKDYKLYESADITFVVSEIFKISDEEITLIPDNKESVVGSYFGLTWISNKPQIGDWIGLYYLGEIQSYTKALSYIKLNEENAFNGKFNAFLPPNSQAGQYVFVYFRDNMPITVSDIMEAQPPKVTCPNKINLNKNSKNRFANQFQEIFGVDKNEKFEVFNQNENNNLNILNRKKKTKSNIEHLVIICTENHSFDSYMGEYCESEAFTNPNCNYGSKCCEKPPKTVSGFKPFILNNSQNLKWDPNHNQYCELCEINNGKMDGYVKGCKCSNPQNFAVADKETIKVLHDYARNFSLADRFFQSNAGASSQNNMYLARAAHVFIDNRKSPLGSIGSNCIYLIRFLLDELQLYYDPTISHLLAYCNFTLRSYVEGYEDAKNDFFKNPCYPQGYDSSDIPYNYYAWLIDNPNNMDDYKNFSLHLKNKTLPEVSFIKPLGIRTGHPGFSNITDEMKFIKETIDMILNDSYYYENTLIVYLPNESGGYYDHISPPPTNNIDGVPYGARIPFLAIGKFAKKNYISHVTMEHSSIVKFIEWNWLNGETGQLNVRDKNVNSIGDLIDNEKAGISIP